MWHLPRVCDHHHPASDVQGHSADDEDDPFVRRRVAGLIENEHRVRGIVAVEVQHATRASEATHLAVRATRAIRVRPHAANMRGDRERIAMTRILNAKGDPRDVIEAKENLRAHPLEVYGREAQRAFFGIGNGVVIRLCLGELDGVVGLRVDEERANRRQQLRVVSLGAEECLETRVEPEADLETHVMLASSLTQPCFGVHLLEGLCRVREFLCHARGERSHVAIEHVPELVHA